MHDITAIASQVKYNCNISDAKFWGYYSPCGLLLRLRDLYRKEKSLHPWEGISTPHIKTWIDEREKLWNELESLHFQGIRVSGFTYAPFDAGRINSHIKNNGVVYGAGYGNRMKPVFMLAEISEYNMVNNYHIYVTGREFARDLSVSFAMIQGNTIFIRQEAMEMFYWSKYEEMKALKCSGTLHHAFGEYGITKDATNNDSFETVKGKFASMIRDEVPVFIYHELGEASQRKVTGRWWRQLLQKLPHSRAELFVRSLKDVLADTCDDGMLFHIINARKRGSLAFYVAFLTGYRRVIFPEIMHAYSLFRHKSDWDLIEKARLQGYKNARDYLKKLRKTVHQGTVSAKSIEEVFLKNIA